MNTTTRNYPRTFNSMLDTFFNANVNTSSSTKRRFIPSADVSETDAAFQIDIAVPGIDKKDISLDIKDKAIVVTGERSFGEEKKSENFHLVENQYGTFKRSFLIPENVNAGKIEAKHLNGILQITLPKEEVEKLETKVDIL